jgi:hypothetical protein
MGIYFWSFADGKTPRPDATKQLGAFFATFAVKNSGSYILYHRESDFLSA